MRELRPEEMVSVGFGLLPVTPLPGVTVRPDPGRQDTLPYSRRAPVLIRVAVVAPSPPSVAALVVA